MKAGKEHRAPLSGRALAILQEMRARAPQSGADAFVFPGAKHNSKPLSNMALIMLLRRLGHGDLTVHGFAQPSAIGFRSKLTSQPKLRNWPWHTP